MVKYAFLLVAMQVTLSAQAQFGLQQSINYGPEALLANPALMLDHRITVQLGNFSYGTAFNFKPSDLGARDGDRFNISPRQVRANLPDIPEAQGEIDASTLLVNIRQSQSQFGFHHSFRSFADVRTSKDLIRLLGEGNAGLVGDTIRFFPEGNVTSWHEIGGHYARALGEKLMLGGGVKVLLGSNDIRVASGQTSLLAVQPENYLVDYDVDISVQTAGYQVDIDNRDFALPDKLIGAGEGIGIAFDLGLVFRASDNLELGLAARDIGSINWKNGARHTALGSGSFAGVEGNVFAPGYSFSAEGALDSLEAQAQLSSMAESYSTSLPAKLNAHARYRLSEAADLSATVIWQQRETGSNFGGSTGLSYALSDKVRGGVSLGYAFEEFVIGLRASVMVGPVLVFASTDQIQGLSGRYESNQTMFRLGIALAFDRIKSGSFAQLGWYDALTPNDGKVTPSNAL